MEAEVTHCPPVVDKTNWDLNAAVPLENSDDSFEVVVHDGGLLRNVSITHSTAENWEMNLAFECCCEVRLEFVSRAVVADQ